MGKQRAEVTRDEVLYQQIKDSRALFRGLAVVYAIATLAAIIMGIICLFTGRLIPFIQLVMFVLGLGTSTYLSWDQYKDYDFALKEIGPDPTGVDTCKTYSMRTAGVISVSRLSKKELLQQWIAYGILTFTLFFFGIPLLLLFLDPYSTDMLFLGVGGFFLAGGAILAYLTVKAFHAWRAVRRLEKHSMQ